MASQSIIPVINANPIRNGSVVTFAQETGGYQTSAPAINQHANSGTLSARLTVRFDEHYGGMTCSGCN